MYISFLRGICTSLRRLLVFGSRVYVLCLPAGPAGRGRIPCAHIFVCESTEYFDSKLQSVQSRSAVWSRQQCCAVPVAHTLARTRHPHGRRAAAPKFLRSISRFLFRAYYTTYLSRDED